LIGTKISQKAMSLTEIFLFKDVRPFLDYFKEKIFFAPFALATLIVGGFLNAFGFISLRNS
jgi:hypothetical protein